MKAKYLDTAYAVFMAMLYCLLIIFSPCEDAFELIALSYYEFLQVVEQFSVIMEIKGVGRRL